MGIDNLSRFRTWHGSHEIQKSYKIIVFDRIAPNRLVNNLFFNFNASAAIDKDTINNIIVNRRILCDTSSTKVRLNGYYDK